MTLAVKSFSLYQPPPPYQFPPPYHALYQSPSGPRRSLAEMNRNIVSSYKSIRQLNPYKDKVLPTYSNKRQLNPYGDRVFRPLPEKADIFIAVAALFKHELKEEELRKLPWNRRDFLSEEDPFQQAVVFEEVSRWEQMCQSLCCEFIRNPSEKLSVWVGLKVWDEFKKKQKFYDLKDKMCISIALVSRLAKILENRPSKITSQGRKLAVLSEEERCFILEISANISNLVLANPSFSNSTLDTLWHGFVSRFQI